MALRGGALRRAGILLTVVLNAVLAVAAAGTLVWLAGRPGLRLRLDLTLNQENTLDANAREVIDNLPRPARIDVFFRPQAPPIDKLVAEVQGRMFELLVLAEEHAPERIELVHHPYRPPGAGGAELQAEMHALGVHDFNVFVVSCGDRRAQVHLLGDVAEIDLGNPSPDRGQYRPPSLVEFRGLESLVEALLRVTRGERPLALFSAGHGERAIFEDGDRNLGRLHSALLEDGFRVETWDPEEDGAVPEDAALLAIVGPEEPFSEAAAGWIADYVRRGGSLVAAPSLFPVGGPTSVEGMLATLGIVTQPGFVCRPVINAAGMPVYGDPRSAEVLVRAAGMQPRHPVTRPLREGDRRVRSTFTHAFERGTPPTGGVLRELLRTDEYTWLEFPDADGQHDWAWNQGREREGPFTLAMSCSFPPVEVGPAPLSANAAVEECRVLALGSPEVLANALFDTNRDLALNAFNWAASREFRVSVSPRVLDQRRIDVTQDRTLFRLNVICLGALPLLCLSLAALAAWRRKR
jgi:hypothetical protein